MGLNPIDLGLVKRHKLSGVPPMINQEEILTKLLKKLGYDYSKLQQKAEA